MINTTDNLPSLGQQSCHIATCKFSLFQLVTLVFPVLLVLPHPLAVSVYSSNKCGWNIVCNVRTHTLHTETHNQHKQTLCCWCSLFGDMLPHTGVHLKMSNAHSLSEKYLCATRINGLSPHQYGYCQLNSITCKAEKCRREQNQSIFCLVPYVFCPHLTQLTTVHV